MYDEITLVVRFCLMLIEFQQNCSAATFIRVPNCLSPTDSSLNSAISELLLRIIAFKNVT